MNTVTWIEYEVRYIFNGVMRSMLVDALDIVPGDAVLHAQAKPFDYH